MNRINRYKKTISAILLLLYAFIAMPVQLWHHHHQVAGTDVIAVSDYTTVSAGTGLLTEANCPICQHHYSAYDNDARFFVLPFVWEFSSQNGHCHLQHCHYPSFSFLNKGPPFHF